MVSGILVDDIQQCKGDRASGSSRQQQDSRGSRTYDLSATAVTRKWCEPPAVNVQHTGSLLAILGHTLLTQSSRKSHWMVRVA